MIGGLKPNRIQLNFNLYSVKGVVSMCMPNFLYAINLFTQFAD